MDIPPYLQHKPSLKNKPRTAKNRFSRRILFNLIFIFSLGLNVYLLTYQQDSGIPFAQEKAEMGVANVEEVINEGSFKQEATGPAQVKPIRFQADSEKQSANLQRKNQEIPPSFSITPAAYVVPQPPSRQHVLHLTIRNSLTHSVCRVMTRDTGCETMSAYMSRLLSWFLDINKSMRNGDSLDAVYELVPGQNRFRILKLVYYSQFFKKAFEANYFSRENNGLGSYYNPEGVEIAKRIVDKYAPVRNYQEITSLPGDFRKGPVGHEGTDFKTEVGTDVFASFAGRVTRTNWNRRANGYCVELDHPRQGVKTLYLHLSRVLVKPGQFVKQGDKIAETGNTGRTFSPHLHYEIKNRNNRRIVYNPFQFKHIKSFYQEVPSEEWESFQKTVSRYNSILHNG